MLKKLKASYSDQFKLIRAYWAAYGGISSLLTSPYLHLSILLMVPLHAVWMTKDWWGDVLSVLPSLLGFTVAAYAIFLTFGDDLFRDFISGDDENDGTPSPLMSVSAVFVHFMLIQVFAIFFALIAKSAYETIAPVWFEGCANDVVRLIFWAASYVLFIYALSLGAASVLAIFRVSRWFDQYQTAKKNQAKGN